MEVHEIFASTYPRIVILALHESNDSSFHDLSLPRHAEAIQSDLISLPGPRPPRRVAPPFPFLPLWLKPRARNLNEKRSGPNLGPNEQDTVQIQQRNK